MTGLILLAAGASARLGSPKQLLPYAGKTLLQHAIAAATGSDAMPVIVVLGASANLIRPGISRDPVHIVTHAAWKAGIGSSIKAGLAAFIEKAPQAEGVILMLCDQPFADSALLNSLIRKKQESGKKIIVSAYENTLGVPVLFDKAFFPVLTELEDEAGAKKLLQRYPEAVASVPFPGGGIDIDTRSAYDALIG
ncbi:nucleotidyltransferase family protein [Compostibacter hankyongensis]|uniref:MobA-like NTP transferase domain-containing protein n=1 Tax=Compostibacter hankyongensis TaxID=1007089 RepID=A0ABP8FLW1_9BACT